MNWREIGTLVILVLTVVTGTFVFNSTSDFEACVDVEVKQEQK